MSVELEPAELGFRRPFTREVSQTLRLRNNHNDPMAFKVKTTAPKQYCVRPNSGRIEPGKTVEVQVLLQAMKDDLPIDAKCKDKFLVQSVAVSADQEFTNVGQIWSHIEKTNKSSIQERKIRVFFLPPTGGVVSTPSGTKSATNGTPAGADSSPAPEVYTPERGGGSTVPSGPIAKPESKPEGARHTGEALSHAHSETARQAPSAGGAVSSIAAAIPTSADELKSQLADAKATIARMTEQQGLRRRKGGDEGAGETKSAVSPGGALGVQQMPAEGVPVPVVAGLCLLSFLLAYFFF